MSAVTRRVLERAGARHAFDGSTARGAGSRRDDLHARDERRGRDARRPSPRASGDPRPSR